MAAYLEYVQLLKTSFTEFELVHVPREHNSKVRLRRFQEGDLVMRKAHQNEMENKLSPKWTGPYRVVETLENGAYRLETLEGGAIPRTWNATHLKFYFS